MSVQITQGLFINHSVKKSIWFFSILVPTVRAQMSGIFSVAFCKWHHAARGCSAKLRAPAADEVLTCCSSHLPAWAGSGQTWDRAIYKQNIAHFMPSWKQSAICVGTILFKHSRQSSELCPGEPQSFRRLQGWGGIWCPVLRYPGQGV